MTTGTIADENKLAQEIIKVLPAEAVARLVSEDRETIRFSVAGMKLRSIVLSRHSLRKLCIDPAREIKIEYLQRDLLRSAKKRTEFRYPRLNRLTLSIQRLRRLAMAAGQTY